MLECQSGDSKQHGNGHKAEQFKEKRQSTMRHLDTVSVHMINLHGLSA